VKRLDWLCIFSIIPHGLEGLAYILKISM